MLSFDDEIDARKQLAELLNKCDKVMSNFPFIEKDGKGYHALARLAADVRNNRVPDFQTAGWRW